MNTAFRYNSHTIISNPGFRVRNFKNHGGWIIICRNIETGYWRKIREEHPYSCQAEAEFATENLIQDMLAEAKKTYKNKYAHTRARR